MNTKEDNADSRTTIFLKFIEKVLVMATPERELENNDYDFNIISPCLRLILTKIFKSKSLGSEIQDAVTSNVTCIYNDPDLSNDAISLGSMILCKSNHGAHYQLYKNRKYIAEAILSGKSTHTDDNNYNDSFKYRPLKSLNRILNHNDFSIMQGFIKNPSLSLKTKKALNLEETKLSNQINHSNKIASLKTSRNWEIAFAIIAPIILMILSSAIYNWINHGFLAMALAFYYHFFSWTLIDRIILILACDIPLGVGIHRNNQKLKHMN